MRRCEDWNSCRTHWRSSDACANPSSIKQRRAQNYQFGVNHIADKSSKNDDKQQITNAIPHELGKPINAPKIRNRADPRREITYFPSPTIARPNHAAHCKHNAETHTDLTQFARTRTHVTKTNQCTLNYKKNGRWRQCGSIVKQK